jgi:hypothetical protein
MSPDRTPSASRSAGRKDAPVHAGMPSLESIRTRVDAWTSSTAPPKGARVLGRGAKWLGSHVKREAGPGIGSGGATRRGSKESRSREGWRFPDQAGGEAPAQRVNTGSGTGTTGSRLASMPRRRRGGRRSGDECRRSHPPTRERRLPPSCRGRVRPGPTAWPGCTTAITTNVSTSRASEPSPWGHPDFLRRSMMESKIHECQVASRFLVSNRSRRRARSG